MVADEERRKLFCACGKTLGMFTAKGLQLYCRFPNGRVEDWRGTP